MHTIGIIAEYNPFHNGHRYQIDELRRMFPATDGIVALMSGSFTQRGAPCVLDKWTRARHAVAGGADLVLELPFVFACRSAQDFARGAVSLLRGLGIIDRLAFGTETSDINLLLKAAILIDTERVQDRLHKHIGAGDSYAAALSRALASTDIAEDILRAPNNILAVEYLRALRQSAPEIVPVAIPRKGVRHNDAMLHAHITSASSIRAALSGGTPPWSLLQDAVIPPVYTDLKAAYETGLPSEDMLLQLLRYTLLTERSAALREIRGITEGVENRLCRAAQVTHSYDNLLTVATTKRYPRSRIARLVIHLLTRFKEAQAKRFDVRGAAYIRPLAFNTRGQALLRRIKKCSQLPVVTRTAAFLTSDERSTMEQGSLLQEMLSFDTLATELRLLTMPREKHPRTDFITSPCALTSIPKGRIS